MLRLKSKRNLIFVLILIFGLFICDSMVIFGQISHRDIVDKLANRIVIVNTKLESIDKVKDINSDSYIIDNVQKSFEIIKNKLDELSKVPSSGISDPELKVLEHLSNIEKDINKLLQIELTEKVADKDDPKPETLNYGLIPTPIEFGLGADFVSRYVWRGNDFGDSPNIQPYITISYSGFELGTWASYPFSTISSIDNELDLSFSYSHKTESGNIRAAITDYYFPNAGINFSNWKSNGIGAHTLELAITYTGSAVLPISILTAYNIHNDPDKSLYIELGYPVNINEFDISIFLAGAKGTSTWYGLTTERFELINLGFTSSKKISLTEIFYLTVKGSYIMNPFTKQTYLVFGIIL